MDNETAEIAVYEGAIWMGVQIALTWATYAQWIFIYLMDFLRIALQRLKSRNLRGATISDDAKNLCKIPKHLAVILQSEAELEDLANIVLWSFLLGVPFITVHGRNGFSELVFKEFVKLCEKKKQELKEELLAIHYHNQAKLQPDSLNGCHVMMSSVREGRQRFVDVARALCEEVQQGTLRPDEIDLKKMNEAFQDYLPEPDLAISFGSYPSFHGLHPWSTRLTEIMDFSRGRTGSCKFQPTRKGYRVFYQFLLSLGPTKDRHTQQEL